VFQTIGLPLLFVPMTSASYADVPPDKTSQASALINVARNLGGSIGVSIAGALLTQRTQFHQARLVEHIAPSSQAFQQALPALQAHLSERGVGAADAKAQALGLIGKAVATQSTLIAYMDVFFCYALAALAMAIIALIMLKKIDLQHRPAGTH
jgi:DHA2 family multidrug resistance protein